MTEKQKAIVQAIHDGASIAQAAQMAGVPEATVRGWLKFGRKNATGPFGEFARRVDQLRERVSVPLDTGPGRMVTSVDAHLAGLTLGTGQAAQAAALRTVAEILDWAETVGNGPAVRILVRVPPRSPAPRTNCSRPVACSR